MREGIKTKRNSMKKRLPLFLALLLLLSPALGLMETQVAKVFHAPSASKAPFAPAQMLEQAPFAAEDGILQVDIINVKVGDAILLRMGGESMMIDGGTRGKAAMLELFFKSQGITGFTYFFNTHSHDDHIEASTRLVELGYTAREYLSKYTREARLPELTKLYNALDAKGIPLRTVVPGETMMLGGAELTFLQNTREHQTGVNARSMMLHVRYKNASILLPADVTGASLGEVQEDYADYMDVDIIKSPHHGINRLRQEFLDATSPELFVITSNMDGGATLAKQLVSAGMPHYFISMGTVSLQTDGEVWYVQQTKLD